MNSLLCTSVSVYSDMFNILLLRQVQHPISPLDPLRLQCSCCPYCRLGRVKELGCHLLHARSQVGMLAVRIGILDWIEAAKVVYKVHRTLRGALLRRVGGYGSVEFLDSFYGRRSPLRWVQRQ